MGKMSRDKGNRIEREIINLHRDYGVRAERVPLSGASHYQGEEHDINIYAYGRYEIPLNCEVKARASGAGFTMLEKWLCGNDVLFLRRDHASPMVVLPWNTWMDVLRRMGANCQDADHSTATRQKPKSGLDDAA